MDTPLIAEMSNASATFSSIVTMSASSTLHDKLQAKLQVLRLLRTKLGCGGIIKVALRMSTKMLAKLKAEGKAKIATWNREEVKVRDGTAEDFLRSLLMGLSPGMMLAYWNGILVDGKVVPTVENPIIIYEGGHRTRWTESIFANITEMDGMTLSYFQANDPVIAKCVEDAIIEMTVSTHPSGVVNEEFVKKDYEESNSKSEHVTPGEILRVQTTDNRTPLQEDIKRAMRRNIKEKKQDGNLEILRAMVHGAAGCTAQMTMKKGDLMTQAELTPEQLNKARTTIAALASAETGIASLYSATDKETKKVLKRVMARQLDLSVDGVYVAALASASTDAARQAVVDDIVEFHRRFFADKTVWAEVMKDLKKATVDRSRYPKGSEGPFRARWQKIVNHLRPIALDAAEGALPPAQELTA
jgi:hypothetical protein